MLTETQRQRVAAIRKTRSLHCSGPCNHTQDEHDAFDLGIADGEAGNNENPFIDPNLRHGWICGHSIAAQMGGVVTKLFGEHANAGH